MNGFIPLQGASLVAQQNPPASAGDTGLTPGSGKSPGEGNDNPLWHSYLENSMAEGTWWASAPGAQRV